MKIAVIPNLDKRDADTYTREILAVLQENGAETLMHEKHRGQYEHVTFCKNHAALAESCDLIVAVGGDGTIIHTAKHASVAGKPILGVNLGRLGFLAGVEKDELHKLKALFTGDYRVRRLMMLSVTVHSVKGDTTYRALNDAVVSGAQSRIYDFGFSVDGSKLYKFRADGLILATPAGSTAYSLSAGGPVVEPTARNFIVSPICAHSVHANAYVLSPERVITVQTEKNSYKPVLLSVDGGRAFSLRSGDSIEVRRSKFDTKLVRLSKRSFCEILQKKMLMGGTSNEE